MSRRHLLGVVAGLASGWLGLPSGVRAASAASAERIGARAALSAVKRWGAQYQDIDLDAIAASDLDLVVLEPSLDDWARRFITPREVRRLKQKPDGSRRLVLAYLPVGETDTKRWYWPEVYRKSVPEWVGPDNPNWPGSRHVKFWDPAWQEIVVGGEDSLFGRILATGYDGALLDRVDAYFDWEHERPTAKRDMIDLVGAIRRMADAQLSGFLLMPQNAEHLMLHDDYLALIDGINKESLLSGLRGENVPNRREDIQWSLDHLRRAERAGVTIFTTEYATSASLRLQLELETLRLGFKPFMGARALDRLPV